MHSIQQRKVKSASYILTLKCNQPIGEFTDELLTAIRLVCVYVCVYVCVCVYVHVCVCVCIRV